MATIFDCMAGGRGGGREEQHNGLYLNWVMWKETSEMVRPPFSTQKVAVHHWLVKSPLSGDNRSCTSKDCSTEVEPQGVSFTGSLS